MQGGGAEEEADDKVRPCLRMDANVFENVRRCGLEHLLELGRQGQGGIARRGKSELYEVHEIFALFE
jgi:hypothetical protein